MPEEIIAYSLPITHPVSLEKAIAHLQEADPIMAKVIERVGPMTLATEKPYFYALASSIISQQISVKAAAAIEKRFLALFPNSDKAEVSPVRLLAVPVEDLRAVGLSGQKARYILDLAEKIELGTVNLAQVEKQDDEIIIQQLIQVKGIGRWTAEMFLIFSLNRPNILPVDDLGFRAAIHKLYGFEERPSPKILKQFAHERGWPPYSTVATWYLWQSLRLEAEN